MQAVAFLDLLGFAECVKRNLRVATSLIENYNAIVADALQDDPPQPPTSRSRSKPSVQGSQGLVHFLPMSDSVFAVSADPTSLVDFLSKFMADSYLYTADAYAGPEDPDDPTRVTIKEVSPTGVREREDEWPPTLFRGGLAYGEVALLWQVALRESCAIHSNNLAGGAVVDTIALEEEGKGPRLFCRKEFANMVTGQSG